jgi:uncharacterized membrane protein
MKPLERFNELDVWRGIALIGMILFHSVFLIDYLGYREFSYFQGIWHVMARFVQFSFLLLVGISLHVSYQRSIILKREKSYFLFQQLKRGLLVFLCGLLVTLFTWYFAPDDYVRFGILHFIGVSIILLTFFADKPFIALFVSGLAVVITPLVSHSTTSVPALLALGFRYPFQSIDYFPVFPWIAIPAFGIFLGSLMYQNYERRWEILKMFSFNNPLAKLGRHSLLVYLLHVPLLLAIIYGLGLLIQA